MAEEGRIETTNPAPEVGATPTPEEKKEEELGIEVSIKDIRYVPTLDPNRIGEIDTIVTYEIGPMQVYTVTIPGKVEDLETIKKYIREAEKKRRRFLGAKIRI